MIRHVVMWSLIEPDDAPRFKALLDGCAALVPGIIEFEVAVRQPQRPGSLDANVDVLLISTFTDAAQLDAYQHHPQHQAVGVQLGAMRASRQVLDYEIAAVNSGSSVAAF